MYYVHMYYLYYFTCVYLTLIHSNAVVLCVFRSEMTKIFPSDSEPPEETVELWTGGRQQQQQQKQQRLTESKQQRLLRLLRCITRNTDSRQDELFDSTSKSKMKNMFTSLLCLQLGTCHQNSIGSSMEQMLQCYSPECLERCQESEDFTGCLSTCMQPGRSRLLHTILKRRVPQNNIQKMALSELYDLLSETETRDVPDRQNGLNRSDHKRKEMSLKKRYRLGLYDCISSYCGQLSGADRKSCIINYCHRSTTIKM